LTGTVTRRIPFRVGLCVAVGSVSERVGWLLEGEHGWGEFSPLPGWSPEEVAAAEGAAVEAATRPFPDAVRPQVEVNALVPRVGTDQARSLVRAAMVAGCRTMKVKVGDGDSMARVAAVRETLGPEGVIRLDANGAWDPETAESALRNLSRYGIELCEDPVGNLEDLAALRRRCAVPVAAEACVRTLEDARRLKLLSAADAVVLKPQRMGGVRVALDAAEAAGVPAIASSALETSVGLAAVLALAASLPDLEFACGIGTALLLTEDPVLDPLIPQEGRLTPRRPQIDEDRLAALAPPGVPGGARR